MTPQNDPAELPSRTGGSTAASVWRPPATRNDPTAPYPYAPTAELPTAAEPAALPIGAAGTTLAPGDTAEALPPGTAPATPLAAGAVLPGAGDVPPGSADAGAVPPAAGPTPGGGSPPEGAAGPPAGDGVDGPEWLRQVRRLRRRRQGRVVAGVAGGLADYLRVDPVIMRLAFVGLTFAGGFGLLLYLLLWAFVPQQGADAAAGERLLASIAAGPAWLRVTLLVLAVLAALAALAPSVPAMLVVLVVVVVLLARDRGGNGATATQ